jgi:hypothetical protein
MRTLFKIQIHALIVKFASIGDGIFQTSDAIHQVLKAFICLGVGIGLDNGEQLAQSKTQLGFGLT